MAFTLKQIREAAGGLEHLTDEDILSATYETLGSEFGSLDEYAASAGYSGAGRGNWGSQFSAAVDRYQAGMYGLGEAVTGALKPGQTTAEDWFRKNRIENEAAANYASQRAREQGAIQSYKDVEGVGDVLPYIGSLAVQSSPYLAEAATGGVAGRALIGGTKLGLTALGRNVASGAGAAAASYPSAAGEILQAQREQSGETDLMSAGALAVPFAALNVLGVEGALARGAATRAGVQALDRMVGLKGAAARTGVTAAKGGVGESISEVGQEMLSQRGRMAVDPDAEMFSPDAMERYKESAIAGFTLGGSVSGAAGGWRRTQEGGTDLTKPSTQPVGLQDTGVLGESITGTDTTSMLTQRSAGLTGSATPLPLGKTLTTTDEGKSAEQIIAEQEETTTDVEKAATSPASQILSPDLELLADYQVDRNKTRGPKQQKRGADLIRRYEAVTSDIAAEDPAALATAREERLPGSGEYILQGNWPKLEKLLAKAEEDAAYAARAQAAAEGVTNVGDTTAPVPQPTGSVGGPSPDVAGSVAPTGPVLTGERGLSAGGDTAGAVPADGQALPVSSTAVQPSAAVVPEVTVDDGYDSTAAAWADFAPEGAPAFEELPAGLQQGWAEIRQGGGMTQEAAAAVAQEAQATETAPEALLSTMDEIFGKRDAQIIYDTVVDNLPATEVANKNGIGRSRVPQIVSEKAITARVNKYAKAKGWTTEYTDALLSRLKPVQQAPVAEQAADQESEFSPVESAPLEAEDSAFGVQNLEAGEAVQKDLTFSQAGFSTAPTIGGSVSNWQDTLGKLSGKKLASGRKLTAGDQTKLEALVEKRAAAEAKGDEAAMERVDAELSQLETNYLTPQELAASYTQKAYDLLNTADKLQQDIDAAVADGRDTVAYKNRKKPLIEVEQEIAKVNEKVAAAMAEAEAILKRGTSRAKQGAAPVAPKVTTKKSRKVVREPVQVTAEPTAQASWDAAVADFPDAPKFADLTKEQQQTFTDFGPDNWTAADVTQELAKIQRQITATATNKSKSGDRVTIGEDKDAFTGVVSSRAEIEQNPAAKRALDSYVNNGLGDYVDSVDLWVLADSDSDFDAAVLVHNGQKTLAIRVDIFENDPDLTFTSIHHEMGHILDGVLEGEFNFSQNSELNSVVKDGKVIGYGPVIREILAYYTTNKNKTALSQFFKYPLKFKAEGAPTSERLREEVFAQLWALFNLPKGNKALREELPIAYAYMETVYEAAYQAKNQPTGATQGAAAPQATAREKAAEKVSGAAVGLRAARVSNNIRFTDRVINKLPQGIRAPIRFSRDVLAGWLSKGVDYVVFTNDLVNRMASQGMASARVFAKLLAQSRAMSSEMERAIEKIADKYALIEEADKGTGPRSANQFLFESTRTGKWGYGKNADPEMAAWFNELGPKSQAFVQEIFAHGDAILAKKKKIVMDSANTEYDSRIAEEKAKNNQAEVTKLENEKKATLSRFQTLFKIHEGKPYAPIKRQGSHIVVAKSTQYTLAEQDVKNNLPGATKALRKLEQDPDHYHVTFTDGKIAGMSLQRRLEEQGAFATVELVEKRDPKADVFGGESLLPALNKIKAGVDAEVANGDRSAVRMRTLISDMYLQALAEASARKSEMRRRGIAGEVDMLQSFTQQGRADALFLANIQNSPKIQKALRDTFNESKAGGDRTRKSELFNELEARYVESLEYAPNEFVSGLTNLSSKYFLATSIGYYVQNLTQPFMMSLPAMAGKHAYTTVSTQLLKAYSELGPIMKATKLFDQQFDFSKVPKDVADAVAELVNRNVIDIGLATEIAEYKVDADSKLTNTASKINKGMRLAVQKTEAINRLSTAIAAYRLEIAAGSTKEQAVDYAQRILTETHGDYTSFNAPRAFNTTYGKVALQFRKFQLIQITFYTKLFNEAFVNGSKAEKAAARKTLTYALSHAAVFAGVMGLPGYAAIAAVLNAVFGDDDEDFDLTQSIREAVGPEWADLVTRGAPTLAGVDFSGKIGYGNMLSITPFSNADLGTTAGQAEWLGTFIGGAALGMTSRVADGLVLMAGGDWYKGVERTMPKGVSDAMKAFRTQTEGMTRRNGDVILPAEEVDTLANIFSAIGVPSAQQAVVYENRNLARDIKAKFTDRTSRIKNDYIKAVKDKDQEGMKEARAAWKKLQDAKRRNGVKPTPLSSLLKAPMEQRKRERNTVGGVQYTKQDRALARAIALED